MLLSIQGGSNLGIFEINDAARLVQEAVHPEANIIFGAVIDDTLGDEVRVTVIAAGFDGGEPSAKPQPVEATAHELRAGGRRRGRRRLVGSAAATPPRRHRRDRHRRARRDRELGRGRRRPPADQIVVDPAFDDDDDDLDIPDFLK